MLAGGRRAVGPREWERERERARAPPQFQPRAAATGGKEMQQANRTDRDTQATPDFYRFRFGSLGRWRGKSEGSAAARKFFKRGERSGQNDDEWQPKKSPTKTNEN